MPKTAVAVGCAVGVPGAVGLLICLFFWYRSSRRFKKESMEDVDIDAKDMDLSSLYARPHKPGFAPPVDPSTGDELSIRERDLDHISDTKYESQANKDSSIAFGVDTSDGTKNSGTDITTNSSSHLHTHSNIHSSGGTPGSNYMSFYDSVIPVLPTPDNLPGSAQTMVENSPNGGSQQATPKTPERGSAAQTADFIRHLHKNDSSSFPMTTHTMVNATPSTLNLFNNYQRSSSTSTSRNGSMTGLNGSQDGIAGTKAYPRSGALSKATSQDNIGLLRSARGSNQSLLMMGQESPKRALNSTAEGFTNPSSPGWKTDTETGEIQPHSLLEGTILATSEAPLKPSPFDTPPRNRSSHVFADDDEDSSE
ncbi:unnamed protein product [Kuraishia capsulata CBS 1993]|uniref:Uncharacterized protein n=1 Tax=Kuraishia capsulata CBS 1993 TaxID=1382522 RepID=W6MVD4_9ASCO|nr:uncharacterized protein KUCA_T00005896001 [Kuraishia capsulata CBS 1993]CDK29902.1 unnamed protein product [Kuraishia capsulata CBS 1993]